MTGDLRACALGRLTVISMKLFMGSPYKLPLKWVYSKLAGWWFQIFIFIPFLGEMIEFDLRIIFQMGGSTTTYIDEIFGMGEGHEGT